VREPIVIAEPPRPRSRLRLAFAAVFLAAVGLWIGCCGPRNLERYPKKETSPYRLPFAGSRWVCQGNNGVISHSGGIEFAYDFYMPEGTDVLAARGGVVLATRGDVPDRRIGRDQPANYVAIDHGDGTVGWYLHLKQGGPLVKPGERVERGQRIALSGWTGRAMIPHLHFEVTSGSEGRTTIPVTFADADGDGIPRAPFFARPIPPAAR
jgi:murein DD-endopeptidase MepM/ murein hydrolase activator NlpD